MDARADVEKLLQALAGQLGLSRLELDDDDALNLRLSGQTLRLAYSEELEELVSLIYLTPALPEAAAERRELLADLMRGNYAWAGTDGGVLGLEGDQVCLARRYGLWRESGPSFLEKLARQVGLAVFWTDVLEKRRALP
jgi:hypothetical protein